MSVPRWVRVLWNCQTVSMRRWRGQYDLFWAPQTSDVKKSWKMIKNTGWSQKALVRQLRNIGA
ncbi:hypothetical protein E4U19_007709, partial [Claviceps sp. Clav32 group G5]